MRAREAERGRKLPRVHLREGGERAHISGHDRFCVQLGNESQFNSLFADTDHYFQDSFSEQDWIYSSYLDT